MILTLSNHAALRTWRQMASVDQAMGKSLERLSSGLRLNRAGDDVAGFAISERMRTQVRSLNQAIKNTQDGISLLQTAEAGLSGVSDMLQRMRELALQSANGTLQPADRAALQIEMDQLAVEITRTAQAAEFNGKRLLDGSLTSLQLQIGPNAGQDLSVGIAAMDARSLGVSHEATAVNGGVVVANQPIGALASNGAVAAVVSVAGGLTDDTYTIRYDNTIQSLQLLDGLGNTIGPALSVNPWQLGQVVSLGDINTDRVVSVRLPNALPMGPVDDAVTVTGNPLTSLQVLAGPDAIEQVGKGLATGTYRVAYDVATNMFQLQTTAGAGIGPWAAADPLTNKVTVGDQNTSQTLRVEVQPVIATSGWATVTVVDASGAAGPPGPGLEIRTPEMARAALGQIDKAISRVTGQRSQIGAVVNRLEHTINSLATNAENLTAAESRIRDADMAAEIAEFARQQILLQASAAMLAQVNQLSREVILALLPK